MGRFINADGEIAGIGGDILGNNMFTYCMNNPVNMDDPSGQWPKWIKGAIKVVSGALQVAGGTTLGATVGWTGIGAAAAGLLVVNGLATMTQGVSQIVNDVAKSNILREDNIVRTGVKEVGKSLGGDTGEKIAGVVYDTAVVAAGIYAGSSMAKEPLQQAGKIPVKVSINKVYGNPKDPFFTVGPKTGLVTEKIHNILRGNLIDWQELQAFAQPNGYYQLNAGHHLYKALSDLGYETIKVYLK